VYAGIHFPFSLFGSMMRLLLIWLINTIALFVLPLILQSVQIDSFTTALVAALVLGLINTLIRPILIFLTFPVTVLTLGLFILVVNGLMFWAASDLVQGFQVAGFSSAVLGALLYSVISWLLSAIFIRK
jgi:putative membrane protein